MPGNYSHDMQLLNFMVTTEQRRGTGQQHVTLKVKAHPKSFLRGTRAKDL